MKHLDLPRLTPDILAHAKRDYPREACGLVVEHLGIQVYVPCPNLAPKGDQFHLDPKVHADVERRGDVIAVVHSHPDAEPLLSDLDRHTMTTWQLPWVVVSCPKNDVRVFQPSVPPLLGREFKHGTQDCFTLIRDYYSSTLGIQLPDFPHEDDWWANGKNLYLDGYASAGFVEVPKGKPMQVHDVPLMRLRATVPNHAGIYLGSGIILHHVPQRLSRRDSYTGLWASITDIVVRHHLLGA